MGISGRVVGDGHKCDCIWLYLFIAGVLAVLSRDFEACVKAFPSAAMYVRGFFAFGA